MNYKESTASHLQITLFIKLIYIISFFQSDYYSIILLLRLSRTNLTGLLSEVIFEINLHLLPLLYLQFVLEYKALLY